MMKYAKMVFSLVLSLALLFGVGIPAFAAITQVESVNTFQPLNAGNESQENATLYYQGHASLRITTKEGKVIYVDPSSGSGYNVSADLILVTHPHNDHNAVHLVVNRNPGCVIITHVEALVSGDYKKFDLGYVIVEAVQAGNNPNHNINVCVGYILTLSDGVSIYIAGDTSTTPQMSQLAARKLDYAFFPTDGRFNMGLVEAAVCADLVNARYSIPYHLVPGTLFNRPLAEQFNAKNRLIIADGETIVLRPAYTVKFVDWDGKVLDTQTVEQGRSAMSPASPKRDNYTLIGWDKDFSNITEDMTVTALYEKYEKEDSTGCNAVGYGYFLFVLLGLFTVLKK